MKVTEPAPGIPESVTLPTVNAAMEKAHNQMVDFAKMYKLPVEHLPVVSRLLSMGLGVALGELGIKLDTTGGVK